MTLVQLIPLFFVNTLVGLFAGWLVDKLAPARWTHGRFELVAIAVAVFQTLLGMSHSAPLLEVATTMVASTLGLLLYIHIQRHQKPAPVNHTFRLIYLPVMALVLLLDAMCADNKFEVFVDLALVLVCVWGFRKVVNALPASW